jgi:uncharacterized membrane protein
MEAFSDGVFAVIITIMVLEMKSPHGTSLAALQPLFPVFLSYVLSFVYVGIYWNNYHHLLQAAKHVAGGILWANLHLLFWLSLTPFVTAYFLLTKTLIAHHGKDSTLAASIGSDRKGMVSLVVYAVAIPLSFVHPWIAFACYVTVAIIWLLPDPRIEKALGQ